MARKAKARFPIRQIVGTSTTISPTLHDCSACETTHAPRCVECQEDLAKVDHVFGEALCIGCAQANMEESGES